MRPSQERITIQGQSQDSNSSPPESKARCQTNNLLKTVSCSKGLCHQAFCPQSIYFLKASVSWGGCGWRMMHADGMFSVRKHQSKPLKGSPQGSKCYSAYQRWTQVSISCCKIGCTPKCRKGGQVISLPSALWDSSFSCGSEPQKVVAAFRYTGG